MLPGVIMGEANSGTQIHERLNSQEKYGKKIRLINSNFKSLEQETIFCQKNSLDMIVSLLIPWTAA